MTFSSPISLLWLLLLFPMGWFWWRSLVDQEKGKKWGAIILRGLGFLFLILALAKPYWKSKNDSLHVIYLVDGSQSVSVESLKSAPEWIKESQDALRARDSSDCFLFAQQLRKMTVEELREFSSRAEKGTTDAEFRSATRLVETIKAVRFSFPADKAKRLVILSDGVPTTHPFSSLMEELEKEGIQTYFHPLDPLDTPEVAALSLKPSSDFSYQDEMMRFTATLQSNTDQSVKARLLHRGVVMAEDTITLRANETETRVFDAEMRTPGMNLWTLEVQATSDYFQNNNSVSTTVKVKGMPRYLILHEEEKWMTPLTRAMKKQGIIMETRGEFGLPKTLNELLAFDGIILANVSATAFSEEQMTNLKRYVTDFGGGLLMLGSDNSFGLGGYYKSEVEEVLPLTSRYEKESKKPSLAIVLVIDTSGSMSGEPIAMARASAQATAELLGMNDQIGVVGFSGDASLVCDMTSASDQATIMNRISSLNAAGGTNLQPGMIMGRRMLEESVAKVKHMIILSDGQTGGNGYLQMAQEMSSQLITVSTVALGSGAAKELMQSIASEGRGRYYEAETPHQMPKIFTKETMKASRSAIKEDLFNSVVIGDHPILNGYENAELPFILGYVMTRPKPTAQLLLSTETGDPLFAVSRFGLGQGAAYTSDLTENWGSDWLSSPMGQAFWAQALRSIARKDESAGLSAVLHEESDHLRVEIARRDALGQTVDRVPWNILVTDEKGEKVDSTISQSGLGNYELQIPTTEQNKLDLRLHDTLAGLTKSLHWKRAYAAEYKLIKEQDPALTALPQPTTLTENLLTSYSYKNMAWVFVLLGFLSIIAGLVVRRL